MGDSPYRVLIVDDQRDLARAMRLAITSLGEAFEVVDVPSAEEALLEARHRPLDVLVADLRLPGMSGEELIWRVRQMQPGVKVIIVTGLSKEEAEAIAASVQAEVMLRKPLEMADLLDAVERLVGLVESELGEMPGLNSWAQRDQMRQRVSDLLTDLRQELELRSLALIGESGRALVRAGEWPEGIDEARLTARLLTVLSAGNKIPRLLAAQSWHNLYVFATEQNVLFMTPVAEQFALLAWCSLQHTDERLTQTVRALWDATEKLHRVLQEWGLVPGARGTEPRDAEPAATEAAAASDPPEAEIPAELLELLAPDQLNLEPEEAEAFWESLVAEDPGVTETAADALSFDQAQQLGLVPPTEDDDQG